TGIDGPARAYTAAGAWTGGCTARDGTIDATLDLTDALGEVSGVGELAIDAGTTALGDLPVDVAGTRRFREVALSFALDSAPPVPLPVTLNGLLDGDRIDGELDVTVAVTGIPTGPWTCALTR
ncbi:MAG: hypothetical protein ABMB14_29130, partial [Myxococcota bacterium]